MAVSDVQAAADPDPDAFAPPAGYRKQTPIVGAPGL
jgi:hypothetical protein